MTPMIDVVFLLIIFFLVSSHLARQESQIPLPLPVAASGEDEAAEAAPRVTISVDEAGQLFLGGQAITEAMLAVRLEAARAELGENMEVRIRSSRQTPYRDVEPIMLACTGTGIWNVTWAVYREAR